MTSGTVAQRYGNDGCVSSGPYECARSEPTCDPANAPGVPPADAKPTAGHRDCAAVGMVNGTVNGLPGCVEPSTSHIKCGTINGWTDAYDSSANNGQGGCIYTYATGYKIAAPPGTYMYSFQNFVSDVGGAGLEHCTLFVWSNGTTQRSQTVCGS